MGYKIGIDVGGTFTDFVTVGRGEVVTPLDEGEARAAIRRLKALGVEAVAVCFLFSFLNPAHESRVTGLLQEEFPQAFVSLSHERGPRPGSSSGSAPRWSTPTWGPG